ncbi:Uncharacterised protein [Candidatus Bilamarchaeum dharawalense]|uniref:Uncharacterized protein n=1 Tax=Candidatus Bilamarchaeum dharawalense TaxID=2885759 RepID=A0A5E4LUE2_9ARCH|nr:Uncharacterised protein [Candidatus Bilamarchaeum dharawalense]
MIIMADILKTVYVFLDAIKESYHDIVRAPKKNWKRGILIILALIWPLLFLQNMLSSNSQTQTNIFEIPAKETIYDNSQGPHEPMLTEIQQQVGVPDYGASIEINRPNQVVKGSYLDFSVKITEENSDNFHFKDPYYYIIVLGPDKQQRYIFPSGYTTVGGLEPVYGKNYYERPVAWESNPTGNIYDPHCNDGYVYLTTTNRTPVCLSKSELLSGKVDFKVRLDEVGDWEIYVFLYDKDYSPRPYSNGRSQGYEYNAISVVGPEIVNVTTSVTQSSLLEQLQKFLEKFSWSVVFVTVIMSRKKEEIEYSFWWITILALFIGLMNIGIIPKL